MRSRINSFQKHNDKQKEKKELNKINYKPFRDRRLETEHNDEQKEKKEINIT